MADDAELLRDYVENHAGEAFAELVRRYVSLVYHAAQRQLNGDAHTAEEVTQKVFTLLAGKSASLTRHRTLAGWLHTTTRFVASETMRAERRRRAREQEAHLMHELTSDTTAAAEWETLRPVIDATLGELNAEDRDAVLLRFFAAQSLAEVGAKLGVTENTARMRVERALEKLRVRLARRGITSTSAALGVALANQPVLAAPVGLAASVSGVVLATTAPVGGTAALAHLLSFMSTTKIAGGVAGALLMAVAIGMAIRENWECRVAEDSLASANHDSAMLVAKLRVLDQRVQATERSLADLTRRTAEAHATQLAAKARATADAAASKATAEWDPVAEGKAFLTRHPEVKQALVEYSNAQTNSKYGVLLKSANLSPNQIERFQALMREGSSRTAPVGSGGKMGVLKTGPGIPISEIDGQLQEVLGDDGFRMFKQLRSAQSARQLAAQLAGAVCFTDSTLTPMQADQLVQIMMASRPNESGVQRRGFDWDAVIAKAQGVLLPPQLAVLDGLRAQAADQGRILSPSAPSK